MLKRFAAVVGTVAALAWAPGAYALDKVEVVMSSYGFLYLSTLVADELGYFAKEGIDVSITKTDGGSKALAAVVGGDAHVFIGPPSSSFRARAKGTDTLVIGAGLIQYASNLVISGDWAKKMNVTEKSPYEEKLKALKGATIGVTSAGSGTDQVVRFLAKQAGINPDREMTITGLGTGETMTAALVQGRVQGFTHSAPVGENAVKNHGAVMLFDMARGEVKPLDGFLYIGIIARQSWVEKNPDLAVRFLKAQQKALTTMHDPQETLKARDAVWQKYHNKTEKQFYDYVWEATTPAFPKSVEITPDMIKRVTEFLNEFEKTPLDPAAVEKGWTNDYAQKAVAAMKTAAR